MRKVVLYYLQSLDGVAESPRDFIFDWDEVMNENLRRVIADQDEVLLGRRIYDEWSEYWTGAGRDVEPFASFINTVHKSVLSSTISERSWTNTTFVARPLDQLIEELREQPGGDIGVHGSISLAQSLLKRQLVDEVRLVIAPTLVGHGRRLFDGPSRIRLDLTRSVTSPTGYQLVDLRVRA
jgi:dihydrofolate reductase